MHLKISIYGQSWKYMPIIPAIQEVETRKTEVQGQPRQKISETPSQTSKSVIAVCVYNPNYMGGTGKRVAIHGQPQAKSMRP
jgi:hypothetical protein